MLEQRRRRLQLLERLVAELEDGVESIDNCLVRALGPIDATSRA